MEDARIDSGCKTQAPTAPGGLFPKDRVDVDLVASTVTCPAGITVPIGGGRAGRAYVGEACVTCPLRARCTNSTGGRTISVGRYEASLGRARKRQSNADWQADYRGNRPKVERKLGHLMRRRNSGRRARVRGIAQVDAGFRLLAAAVNPARLAVLGLHPTSTGWAAG